MCEGADFREILPRWSQGAIEFDRLDVNKDQVLTVAELQSGLVAEGRLTEAQVAVCVCVCVCVCV